MARSTPISYPGVRCWRCIQVSRVASWSACSGGKKSNRNFLPSLANILRLCPSFVQRYIVKYKETVHLLCCLFSFPGQLKKWYCHVYYQSYSNDRHGKSFTAIILAVLDACDLSDSWSEGWGDKVNQREDKHIHSCTHTKTSKIAYRFKNCYLKSFIHHFDDYFVTEKQKEIEKDNGKLNKRHGWIRLLHSDKRPCTSCLFALWTGWTYVRTKIDKWPELEAGVKKCP